MHDIRWIRENPDAFDAALKRRGLPRQASKLVGLDAIWRSKIFELETAQARRNEASQQIGVAKREKNEEKAKSLLVEVATLKETIASLVADERRLANNLA